MANKEIIDQLVSDAALKSLDELNKKLSSSYDDMEKVLSKAQSFSLEFSKVGDSYSKTIKLINEYEKAEEQVVEIEKAQVRAIRDTESVRSQSEKNIRSQSKAMENLRKEYENSSRSAEKLFKVISDGSDAFLEARESIKSQSKDLVVLKAVLDGTRQEMKLLDAEYRNGGISLEDYKSKKGALIRQEQEQKLETKELQSLVKYNTQIINSSIEAYNRLSAQYSKLKLDLNSMSDAEIRNGKTKEMLQTEASELYSEMIRLQEATGKHTLSVGNYAKGWNGLNVQVSQLVRELPSMTYGFNMFFLAISNNLPMFVDEVKKAKDEFKELTSKGEEAEPVWKQVMKGFMSWQTVMIIGITVLSKYGDVIINWVTSLFGASQATKKLSSEIENINKSFISERLEIDRLFESLKKVEKGTSDYNEIREKIMANYGKYLDGMSNEISLLGDVEAAHKAVALAALESARSKSIDTMIEQASKDAGDAISKNLVKMKSELQRIFGKDVGLEYFSSIRDQLVEGGKLSGEMEKIYKSLDRIVVIPSTGTYTNANPIKLFVDGIIDSKKELEVAVGEAESLVGDLFGKDKNQTEATKSLIKEQESLLKEAELLSEATENEIRLKNIKIKAINTEIERLRALGIETEKSNKGDGKGNDGIPKFLEEERRLALSNAENQIRLDSAAQKEIAESELENYNTRLSNLDKYHNQLYSKIEMAQDNQINELKRRMEKLGLEESSGLNHIEEINQKAQSEKIKLDEETQKIRLAIIKDREREILDTIKSSSESYADQEESVLQLRLVSLSKVYEKEMILHINNEEKRKKITEKYNNDKIEVIRNTSQEAFNAEVDELEELLVKYADNAELQSQISTMIAEVRKKNAKEIADYEISQSERSADKIKSAEEVLQAFLKDKRAEGIKEIWEQSLEMATRYYDTQMDKLEELEKREKEYFDEKKKYIDENVKAGLMSEEEAAARKAILDENLFQKEKQMDEKKKEMKRKQAVWDKANAVVQANISTALAVVKALPNLVLAGIIGAMGLANAIYIATRQVPAYAKGTDLHPGGLAHVGDGNRSELIISPDGSMYKSPAKDTLVFLEKGTIVRPDYEKEMRDLAHPKITDLSGVKNQNIITIFDDQLRSSVNQTNDSLKMINKSIGAIRGNMNYTNQMKSLINTLQTLW